MTALWFLIILAVVFAVVWINLARNANPRAKIGPDGTNVREPETFVVHHEGKGQGLDIANTALKERTEELRRDLPGDQHTVQTAIPGRDVIRMDAPPSDISKFGDEKVAPGADPKRTSLTEGPVGSRPGTPEEPGSPYAKGRRVTDNHRDVELAAEVLPNVFPGMKRHVDRDQAASPSTNGMEPGYGLGRTHPGGSDGEGGGGDPHLANQVEAGFGEEREAGTTVADVLNRGDAVNRGKVIQFRGRTVEEDEITFSPDPAWATTEVAEELDWSGLHEHIPLPETYGEDAIVAMVRNPRSLYVYWERAGFGDENLRSMLGAEGWNKTIPVLRVFDVTSGAWPGQQGGRSFTVPISEADDHWFLNNGIEPGRRYIVSYERATPQGQYYMIAHTSPVETPPEGPDEASALYRMYGRQPGAWSGSPWR